MSDWIRNELGLRPDSEKWSALNGGSFLVGYKVGTPAGNWFDLHNIFDCYNSAPANEKTEVCGVAKEILQAQDVERKCKLQCTAVERWLR